MQMEPVQETHLELLKTGIPQTSYCMVLMHHYHSRSENNDKKNHSSLGGCGSCLKFSICDIREFGK